MTPIEAVYQNGVFKPLEAVPFQENQRVRLSIQPVEASNVPNWLAEVQRLQQQIVGQRGLFPDSTSDIAADRIRDE